MHSQSIVQLKVMNSTFTWNCTNLSKSTIVITVINKPYSKTYHFQSFKSINLIDFQRFQTFCTIQEQLIYSQIFKRCFTSKWHQWNYTNQISNQTSSYNFQISNFRTKKKLLQPAIYYRCTNSFHNLLKSKLIQLSNLRIKFVFNLNSDRNITDYNRRRKFRHICRESASVPLHWNWTSRLSAILASTRQDFR